MKKITGFLLAAFTLFLISSCEHEEVEAGIETFGADFTAYGEAMSTCFEGGGELCPPCCHIIATTVGFIASGGNGANRGVSSSRGLNKTTEMEILLPEQYKITNNPYECDGVTHNKLLLHLINNNRGRQIQGNVLEDRKLLDNVVNTYVDCNPSFGVYESEMRNHLGQSVTVDFYNSQIKKYERITKSQLFSNTRLSSENVKYFQKIYNDVVEIKNDNPNDIGPAMTFINSKIMENLNSEVSLSSNQIIRASSLTLLKHSYFYWVN